MPIFKMKYTKYLIERDFININQLETDNIYLKGPSRIIMVAVIFTGLFFVSGMLPVAVLADGYRMAKYKTITHIRKNEIPK
jgi:hypothetical protein